jgi:hypothetical protein
MTAKIRESNGGKIHQYNVGRKSSSIVSSESLAIRHCSQQLVSLVPLKCDFKKWPSSSLSALSTRIELKMSFSHFRESFRENHVQIFAKIAFQ